MGLRIFKLLVILILYASEELKKVCLSDCVLVSPNNRKTGSDENIAVYNKPMMNI